MQETTKAEKKYLEKKNQVNALTLPSFKINCKATVIRQYGTCIRVDI